MFGRRRCAAAGACSRMACFRPVDAWQRADGGPLFFGAEPPERGGARWNAVRVPCNNCIGCKEEYARKWGVRCWHESQMHRENSFVTLTYADSSQVDLEYNHFTAFVDRLRHRRGSLRYFVAGEYGEQSGRPHFHALLFGVGFADSIKWAKSNSGCQLYRSVELEGLWPFGFSSIGSVTRASAQYCAKYAAKALNSKWQVDRATGEIRPPEFVHMSTRPAIGLGWLQSYSSDVYKAGNGSVVLPGGVKVKAPRYYDRKFGEMDSSLMDDVKEARRLRALENVEDDSDERLRVREEVSKARIRFYKKESGI